MFPAKFVLKKKVLSKMHTGKRTIQKSGIHIYTVSRVRTKESPGHPGPLTTRLLYDSLRWRTSLPYKVSCEFKWSRQSNTFMFYLFSRSVNQPVGMWSIESCWGNVGWSSLTWSLDQALRRGPWHTADLIQLALCCTHNVYETTCVTATG